MLFFIKLLMVVLLPSTGNNDDMDTLSSAQCFMYVHVQKHRLF